MPESDEKRHNDQFDVPWKDILDAYLPDFLEFFLPVAFAEINWVMHLPKKLDDRLNAEILEHEESQKMPYISSMERFLEERGEKKGEAKMLAHQLRSRFGELPTWASEKLNKAEPPFLEEWGLRILDAQSLNAVFADRT